MLLAEEETAARQAAAKQTKKQKQKLRKQLTRQLTQQPPTQHHQHQPEAEPAHVEASQAGQDINSDIHSRLAALAEPDQATPTAAPQPDCAGQHPYCKESDTSQTCTSSSQDHDREADSLVDNPLLSEQGTQQHSAIQTSSRCNESLAQPREPVCSVLTHAPCRDLHAQDILASCVQHSAPSTDLSIAEPASLPAGSLQAWEASVEGTEGSEPEQSGNNRIEGIHLHSLLVCPLSQVGYCYCQISVFQACIHAAALKSIWVICTGDFRATRQYLMIASHHVHGSCTAM